MAGTWRCINFFFSGTTACFQSLCHQEPICRDAQRGMMVKATPTSALVMPKAEFLLQILVVALNAPAHLGHKHPLLKRRINWCGAHEVFCWLALVFGPLNQQPFLGAHTAAPVIPVSGTHPHCRETRTQVAVTAIAPCHCGHDSSSRASASDLTPTGSLPGSRRNRVGFAPRPDQALGGKGCVPGCH